MSSGIKSKVVIQEGEQGLSIRGRPGRDAESIIGPPGKNGILQSVEEHMYLTKQIKNLNQQTQHNIFITSKTII